ncbi:MAG: gliding motility-associated C-terminal domain-containing protein [Flavobacteriales bacterium]|nr:gliding motility-associated C-terminal domain-containing protein [Flavobacteriales bacterium]
MRRLHFLLTTALCLAILPSFATHIIGGEMNYKCLGGNLYEVHLKVYRDCYNGDPDFDDPAAVGIFDANNNLVTTLYLNFLGKQLLDPSINQKDPCVVIPANVCVEATEYIGQANLPPQTGGYQFSYQRCCRNQTIVNLTNPGDVGASYTALVPGPELATCNSNPEFTEWPPIFVCQNMDIGFDHSATDADGDSIVYKLCWPFDGASSNFPQPQPPNSPPYNNVPWKAPFDMNDPLGGTPLSIDPVTGWLTGTPNQLGQYVVGVCAEEYRNGILISTTKRDFQFNVLACESDVVASALNLTMNCATHTVQFINNSTGAVGYFWNFGDGSTLADTSHATDPTWTYPGIGTYTVTLIAYSGTDPACNDTITNLFALVDSCKPCAMEITPSHNNASCSAGSSVCAYPITYNEFLNDAVPVPSPCTGGLFLDFSASSGCPQSLDPWGTSPDQCYYVCGVTNSIPDISQNDFNNCIDPPGSSCPGTGIFVNVHNTNSLYDYICPPANCNATTNACLSPLSDLDYSSKIPPSPDPCPGNGKFLLNLSSNQDEFVNYYGCSSCLTSRTVFEANNKIPPSPDPCSGDGVFLLDPSTNTYWYACRWDGYDGGGSLGDATVSITGANPPYLFSWDNGETTQNISNLAPGKYCVTVGDASGSCVDSVCVTIDGNSDMVITPSVTQVSACGASDGQINVVVAGTGGPFTYLWSPGGQTTTTVSGLSPGIYNVFVTDANGCSSSDQITISNPGTINANLTSIPVSCNGGNDGSISASGSGGTNPYTYQWSPGGLTTQTVGNLSTGYYKVTVTDALGCITTAGINVTEPDTITAAMTSTFTSCYAGNDGTGTVSASGGTPTYTYLWNTTPAQTTATASSLSPGTYSVTVTDANNCTQTAQVTIKQPNAISPELTNTSTSDCGGNGSGSANVQVSGGTAPFTYLWCNGQTTQNVSGLAEGICGVTVTDANSCNASANINITFPTNPVTANTTSQDLLCYGGGLGSITVNHLGGRPGYTYAWSPGGYTTQNVNGLPPGTYIVTVTDADGCSDTSMATITQPPALVTTVTPNGTSCVGINDGVATLTVNGGTPGYFYQWDTNSGNQTTQSATGLSPGIYTVRITDSNGCDTVLATTILEGGASPDSKFSYSTAPDCDGVHILLTNSSTGATSYIWNLGNGSTSNQPNTNLFLPWGDQDYIVTLIAANGFGCADTTVDTINPGPINLGIVPSNVFTPNKDGKNDCFKIPVVPGVENCGELIIFNRWGLRIHDSKDGICWDGRTDTGYDAPEGTYYYVFRLADKVELSGWVALMRSNGS